MVPEKSGDANNRSEPSPSKEEFVTGPKWGGQVRIPMGAKTVPFYDDLDPKKKTKKKSMGYESVQEREGLRFSGKRAFISYAFWKSSESLQFCRIGIYRHQKKSSIDAIDIERKTWGGGQKTRVWNKVELMLSYIRKKTVKSSASEFKRNEWLNVQTTSRNPLEGKRAIQSGTSKHPVQVQRSSLHYYYYVSRF